MKKIVALLLGLFMIFQASGQDREPLPKTRKKQNERKNEVFAAYNYGSLYMTNPYVHRSYPDYPLITDLPEEGYSIGAISAGYSRVLSKAVMYGVLFGFENLYYTGYYPSEGYERRYQATINDYVIHGIALFTFNYLNRPVIRLYSAAGIGVTMAFSTIHGSGPGAVSETTRQLLFAGQLTLFGLRVGRSLGGFFELGVGSVAMVTGGISYRFGE